MKISFKAFFGAVLLATAGFMASSASAATPVVFDADGLAEFRSVNLTKGAAFSETYTFSGLSAGLYNIEASISGIRLAFGLLDATHLNVLLDGKALLTDGSLKAGNLNYDGQAPLLLVVSGTADASGGVSYFNGSISVSAVPEPETYAMMLGGLGLLGFVARRKNRA